jgi:hypothetical protein
MDRLPEIGERVRYHSVSEYWDRECFGTVRKHYPGYYGDSLGQRPIGSKDWGEHWSASVEVDEPLPDWWQYPGTNRFAPSIAELEPA